MTIDYKQLTEKLFSIHAENEWPEFKSFSEADEATINLELYVPNELSWFEGHFPEQAVLPGVVQTHWVGCLSEMLFSLQGFHKVSNLKFKDMIMPDTFVSLDLALNAEQKSVSFKFYSKQSIFTQGKMFFSH